MQYFSSMHLTFSGMAYQGSGMGGILLIETTLVPGGKGKLAMTGSLGDVISESAELALTLVKSRAQALEVGGDRNADPLQGKDIHVSGCCAYTMSSVGDTIDQ